MAGWEGSLVSDCLTTHWVLRTFFIREPSCQGGMKCVLFISVSGNVKSEASVTDLHEEAVFLTFTLSAK